MKTNTKHTPGPWEAFASHAGLYVIDSAEQGAICKIEWCLEDEANARLIAAAPELLQAIKDLFRECAMVHKSWGDGDNTKEADAAIKRAKDAIAKATAE